MDKINIYYKDTIYFDYVLQVVKTLNRITILYILKHQPFTNDIFRQNKSQYVSDNNKHAWEL